LAQNSSQAKVDLQPSSHLQTIVKIPNADKAAFQKAVDTAKTGCPISKLLNATITMDAKLA
jgi:osmotically inducible protein OsmC